MKYHLMTASALGLALSMSLVGATGTLAKGHDQGFGAGVAGPATAGAVDDGQTNRDGNGSETSYGKTDASPEAKDGTRDNSDRARDRDSSDHPSNK